MVTIYQISVGKWCLEVVREAAAPIVEFHKHYLSAWKAGNKWAE